MTHEAEMFLLMAVCGAAGGMLFDFFRGMHLVMKRHTVLIAISDIALWLAFAIVLMGCLYRYNNFRLRAYELFGVVLGAWLYFLTVSRWVKAVFDKIFIIFSIFVSRILKILLTPVHFLYKITVVSFVSVLRKFNRRKIGGGNE